MFLKRLDIVGFKSFAERTTIEFVQGVTAVVGPNGSGKSNITEAIRWVLGEQSARSLRGAKMEDIIFSGSEGRKAVNVAEVTLTLDNGDQYLPLDYHEISITRRAYRSGESEYYINKQACRLKDIVDLFTDSGLGREALSMIGQGKVEQVLSSNADEKRKVIEEAAGVVKYKQRKQKAEAKLQETEENLQRIQDILHELERQMEPLETQASKAKKYLDRKEELETIEVALLVYEIETLYEQWKNKAASLDKTKQQELEMAANMQQMEAQLIALRQEMQTLDETVEDLQEALLFASEDLEKHQGKRQVLQERKKNISQQQRETAEQISTGRKHIDELVKRLTEEEGRLTDERKQLSIVQNKVQDASEKEAHAGEDLQATLEEKRADYIECLNEQTSLKNQLRYLEEQQTQQHQRLKRIDKEMLQCERRRQESIEKMNQLKRRYEREKMKLQKHVSAYDEVKHQLKKAEAERDRLQEQLFQSNHKLQQIRSRQEVLQDVHKDDSGFFQGVQEILQARKRLTGIQGAVAELLVVPRRLETAVETALGGALQHIVVDTEQDAREAIAFLKKHRLGRATFLPMSVMKARFLRENELKRAEQHPKYIGIASRLIHYDKKFHKVISNLLGHVVISEDLQSANEIARWLKHRVRIVTLDGDVVYPGGSMSGGSVKQRKTALLGRRRELETLTKKLVQMENDIQILEQAKNSWTEKAKKRANQLETLRAEGEHTRLHIQALERDSKEMEITAKNMLERWRDYEREKTMYQKEAERFRNQMAETNKAYLDGQKRANELAQEIEELTNIIEKQQMSQAEQQEATTALKIEVAERRQIVNNLAENVAERKDEIAKERARLSDAEQVQQQLAAELQAITAEETISANAISEKQKEKDKTTAMIASKRQERQRLYERTNDEEQKLKAEKRLYKQLTETLKQEEFQLNRCDTELEARLEKLREEYEMTFERGKKKYPLTLEPEKAKEKVELIKHAISELGTVNLGAIEEYERSQDRHHFLTEQREDLLAAKKTLHQVIAEMDAVMKKRFETTFKQIRHHFQDTFRELFKGGHADLKLTDPDDLLLTGVDILAEPPGKKLQHLDLLSGGERALTVIGLLFAVLKARPVPFCVLDEVEAALDETNATRFASFLEQFARNTQFVVATHKKRTMEKANALYGVTMQQQTGISKLVSVKLEETPSSSLVTEETVS